MLRVQSPIAIIEAFTLTLLPFPIKAPSQGSGLAAKLRGTTLERDPDTTPCVEGRGQDFASSYAADLQEAQPHLVYLLVYV